MKGVVFLDRDGVINRDSPDYIRDVSAFEFISGSPEAVALLNRNGFEVIVITNQSMIGRGLSTLEALEAVFTKMKTGIERAGGRILDIFYCPHGPGDGCDCRKPAPGLIYQARDKYGIRLSDSIMVGDSAKDIACARTAGCGKTVLVKTGNGLRAFPELTRKGMPPDCLAEDLYAAAVWIIAQSKA